MNSDNGAIIRLYSKQILELAANIPRIGRLENCDASAKVRSPLCGSTVTVDIVVEDGVITGFAQDVRACALGQASASVVAANVIGRSRSEIEQVRLELREMLEAGGAVPSPPFEQLALLQPARDYRNRHASIQLVLDALVQALGKLEPQTVA
ncbi:MAG: iron-sulfur cluster assembly scaffold protein [Rhodobacteraceae bacterium]|nr:iron-sulfur cluster assembly scaffold protein [Paracoccaceae bacterium]